MHEIYNFLKDLEQHNEREWFDENRERYQATRTQFLHLTDILINEIKTFDPAVGFQDSKKCMFRIFRDVRFSKDKSPYKSNYGSFIAKDGRKGGNPGYYLHIQPGNSFVGGGVYGPPSDKLKKIRSEIYSNPEEFIEIIEAPEFKSAFTMYDSDKLKIAPKGFPKEWEHIDLLRYKSYSPFKPISDEELFDEKFIENVIEDFRKIYHFNRFLYSAIDTD